MRRVIRSIGIVKEIMNDEIAPSDKDKIKVYTGTSETNEKISLQSSSKKQRVVDGFIQHMNDCLTSSIKKILSPEGEDQFTRYIGELINNAQDHSGEQMWSVHGYLDTTNRDKLYQEIVIYNLGKDIASTFKDKREVPEV